MGDLVHSYMAGNLVYHGGQPSAEVIGQVAWDRVMGQAACNRVNGAGGLE